MALGQYQVSGNAAYWLGTISAVFTRFYSFRTTYSWKRLICACSSFSGPSSDGVQNRGYQWRLCVAQRYPSGFLSTAASAICILIRRGTLTVLLVVLLGRVEHARGRDLRHDLGILEADPVSPCSRKRVPTTCPALQQSLGGRPRPVRGYDRRWTSGTLPSAPMSEPSTHECPCCVPGN